MKTLDRIKSQYLEVEPSELVEVAIGVLYDGRVSGIVEWRGKRYWYEWIEQMEWYPEEEELDYHKDSRHYLMFELAPGHVPKQPYWRESSTWPIAAWFDESKMSDAHPEKATRWVDTL